jgi:hypothetical protein
MTDNPKMIQPTKHDNTLAQELTSDGRASGIEREENTNKQSDMTAPFKPSEVEITTRHHTIDLLMNRIERHEIDLQPGFQRKAGVWDSTQKSQFIESLLLRIPIAAFYVAADPNDNWLIVDGLQRLHTLYGFTRLQQFELTHLEFVPQFNGKTFAQLQRNIQRRISETEFVIHVIQPGAPKEVTSTIFKRINTTGLPHSPQEIRHALYQGKSVDFLKQLAESKPFKEATNNDIIDDRMTDQECILRYVAFVINPIAQYAKHRDMDAFLSQTMATLNQAPPTLFEQLQQDFDKSMRAAFNIFGPLAFRKRYKTRQHRILPINRGLFETWSVALSQCNNKQIATLIKNRVLVEERFIRLMNGDYLPTGVKKEKFTFDQAISEHTFNRDRVYFRFKVISSLIQDILNQNES